MIKKVKPSTDDLINSSVSNQNDWLEKRRVYTRDFLKKVNFFSKREKDNVVDNPVPVTRRDTLRSYWFPILCGVIILVLIVVVLIVSLARRKSEPEIVFDGGVPVVATADLTTPSFDIVRIEADGRIVVAGRWKPSANVSVKINNDIVATEHLNTDGEFVYSPTQVLNPGNYTLSLIDADTGVKSQSRVFLYVSEAGYQNSMSLLMTPNGSSVLQKPTVLKDKDLNVSKIDYLDTGRIVVTGDALPRLRVSLTLNGKYLGFARVSDYKHFGIGADVEKLESGKKYRLVIRLHDSEGTTVSKIKYSFIMPEMTGNDDTFYTVRRGDCLWIIARNFMRRGILFSMVAHVNNIQNPNLIFPDQKLQIPVDAK